MNKHPFNFYEQSLELVLFLLLGKLEHYATTIPFVIKTLIVCVQILLHFIIQGRMFPSLLRAFLNFNCTIFFCTFIYSLVQADPNFPIGATVQPKFVHF